MITRKQIGKRITEILERTEIVWGSHHKTSTEALRWWLAYIDAEGMVDTYNMREWAEVVLDGLPPVPSKMSELINEIQGRCEDVEELDGYLQSLEAFYSEE